jgi:hypothetical protein
MFSTLGFNEHQFLVADVRQSMFLFQWVWRYPPRKGPVLDVADSANTAGLDAGPVRCALVMILQ